MACHCNPCKFVKLRSFLARVSLDHKSLQSHVIAITCCERTRCSHSTTKTLRYSDLAHPSKPPSHRKRSGGMRVAIEPGLAKRTESMRRKPCESKPKAKARAKHKKVENPYVFQGFFQRLGLHFGIFLVPVGSISVPFGSMLVPFWLHFGAWWLHFGVRLVLSGCPGALGGPGSRFC